jgi:pimeloyl-ACP methyl ester carboxylesterase
VNIRIDAGSTSLSAIFCGAKNAKALIFCIHGGSYTSRYFNFESQKGSTIFDVAPALGYSVLAVDRPGYGAAEDLLLNFDRQAEILREAAAKSLAQYAPSTAGAFIVGHSIGAMLAMLVASDPGDLRLLGIDLNGAGVAYRPASEKILSAYVAMPDPPREPDKERRLKRMFGPAGTFEPDVADEDFRSAPLSQPAEIKEAVDWPSRAQSVAAAIKVPVSYSLSEFDALWDSSPDKIDRASALFTQSPLVEARMQRFAGHSVHLHHVARAYNLRTIAFADDCLCVPYKERPPAQ